MNPFRQRREELRLSQREVARRVRVQSLTVSRWERGVQAPRERHLRTLARVLQVPLATVREWAGGGA